MEKMIPFNKPFLVGKEMDYIHDSVISGKISGDGLYTKKCHEFFRDVYQFKKALLTTSCTDALEMAAILIDIKPGDEVIMPSYTFVSTANAFVLRGAVIKFVDSKKEHPGMDEELIESLITPKTKAIVPVHYAGVACDMDVIMDLATKYNLYVIEDAAQAIDSYYVGRDGLKRRLGSIGHLAAFSFHETKNIISGEGGLLVINDEHFICRAEIIREKGTNRSSFFRGEVDKYGWVDIGSSFLPSDMIAAFLFAQLENMDSIQEKRMAIWDFYWNELNTLNVQLPLIPSYATNNAHMFYMVFDNLDTRHKFISYLKDRGVHTVFHYQSLHKSAYYLDNYSGEQLLFSDKYTDGLVRLPLHPSISIEERTLVTQVIKDFFVDIN